MSDWATLCCVRPFPNANSVFTPPADRANLYPACAKFLVQRLSETHLGELCHAIDGLPAKAVNACHRGNHQDGA
jgi:hypothetical protein